jgi:hypothetical protein
VALIDQCCYFIEMFQYYVLSTLLYNMKILRIWVTWDLMLPQVGGSTLLDDHSAFVALVFKGQYVLEESLANFLNFV